MVSTSPGSRDVVLAIHGDVGDAGVAGGRQQARHRLRRLCGVERREILEVSDACLRAAEDG